MGTLGCGRLLSHEEMAKQKLEERYDMTFEVAKVLGGGILDECYTVIAYPEDDPKTMFRASINNDGSGESDNYVCKLVCQQISDRIAKNMDSLNGTYYIYTAPLIDSVGLSDIDMTVEQYMEEFPEDVFHVYLNYCPERMDADEFYAGLSNMFKGLEELSGRIYLYIVKENTLGSIQEYLEENDKMYDDYKSMTDSYYVGVIPFEEGKIQLTISEIKDMVGKQ